MINSAYSARRMVFSTRGGDTDGAKMQARTEPTAKSVDCPQPAVRTYEVVIVCVNSWAEPPGDYFWSNQTGFRRIANFRARPPGQLAKYVGPQVLAFLVRSGQSHCWLELSRGVQTASEADPLQRHMSPGCGLRHGATNQVVRNQPRSEFPPDRFRRAAAQAFHTQGGFEVPRLISNSPAAD